MNRTVDATNAILSAGAYRLRPTDARDRQGIAAAGHAPTIGGRMPWFPAPFPDAYADGWVRRAMESWRDGQHWVFSILNADGAYVGGVALSDGARTGVLELAYWVLPEHTGRGAATSAARAVLDWARRELRPQQVWAKAREDNPASLRVLEKAGLVPTGSFDGHRHFKAPDA